MDSFQLNLILLAPLVLGLVLSQLVKMPLKGLTGIYLLLVVGNVFLWFFLMNGAWLTPVIIGAVGLLVGVLATGFFSKRLSPSDYALIMTGVGLFPWALWGVLASVAYGVVLVLFAALIALKPKFRNPFVKFRK